MTAADDAPAPAVSLVIPGRNCAGTLAPCLDAVVPLLEARGGPLREIVFVDDGSTDDSVEIASRYPVEVVRGPGRGPGAARNLGWRSAHHPLIWFVDSDCIVEPGALDRLLPHLDEPGVGAVSGSYGNMRPESLLACLIHEEIVARHEAMPVSVDFLATFNVLYRRSILEQLDGFDERYLKGQDAELAFRVKAAGHELHMEPASRVGHFHETRWLGYLRTQRGQGYWRVWLHLEHRGHGGGDSYSSLLDHVQPPLAMLALATAPAAVVAAIPGAGAWRWVAVLPLLLLAALALAQVPMTARLLRRTRRPALLTFAVLGFMRAFWRGAGMSMGVLRYALARREESAER